MDVRRDTLEPFRVILPNANVFPTGAAIRSEHIHVGKSAFKVFFDKDQHDNERANAQYLFVGVTSSGRPINICAEDELPCLLEAETRCGIFQIGRAHV